MEEEQRYQEGHRLCANDCGFFGSPATLNLCSKCYRDLHLQEEDQASSARIAVGKSLSSSSSSSASAANMVSSAAVAGEVAEPNSPSATEALPTQQPRESNRCAACRKRVGLMGFRCRCGATYCGIHRYPEGHGCGFDYKTAGRDAIARTNPVVKADKIHRRI